MTVWRWRKLGAIWNATGDRWWAKTHAMVPTPIIREGGLIRVYFSSRDARNIGRVGYLDIDAGDPTRIVRVSREPVLDIGMPGAFDDNGVLGCSVVRLPDGRLFLYYVGFELCHHIRYRLLSGLAISTDGGETFIRAKPVPILERSAEETCFRGGPFVVHQNGMFRLWYCAGSQWEAVNGKEMPVYDLRYAESRDGIVWPDRGETCIAVEHDDEHGFGRPYVVPEEYVTPGGAGFRMFYSVRRRSFMAYRFGTAWSPDGRTWIRQDERIGLDVSSDGWDAQAVSYAAPIRIGDTLMAFYNGNGMGETGIGVAVLER